MAKKTEGENNIEENVKKESKKAIVVVIPFKFEGHEYKVGQLIKDDDLIKKIVTSHNEKVVNTLTGE